MIHSPSNPSANILAKQLKIELIKLETRFNRDRFALLAWMLYVGGVHLDGGALASVISIFAENRQGEKLNGCETKLCVGRYIQGNHAAGEKGLKTE